MHIRFRLMPLVLTLMVFQGARSAALETPLPDESFTWQRATPESQSMEAAALQRVQAELARRGTMALLIIRNDHIVMEWYAPKHGAEKRHYTASLAKALVGGLSLALALDDGRIGLDEPAVKYIPHWKSDRRKARITIRQLATHSSGIEDASAPETGTSHNELTGWKGDFWRGRSIQPSPETTRRRLDPFSISVHRAPVVFEPGTDFAYSNPGMALLSYAVTASLRGTSHADIRTLLEKRLFEPMGIEDQEWSIGYGRTYPVDGLPLVANWGGGSFTARAVARIGRLILRRGDWQGRQLIDPRWIDTMIAYGGTPLPDRPRGNPFPAPALGWYNNVDGAFPGLPRDAVCGAGAGNQVLLVVPSAGLIVVRNGSTLGDEKKGEGFWGGLEKYLFQPVFAALTDRESILEKAGGPPCPPSPVIRRINWAPVASIRRRAPGGDNWPITWADDGHLYTAYGDGRGFKPFVPRKLSMGFARISGGPDNFQGDNIRSATGETLGGGPAGKKASGLLMINGTLYAWVRNADNSQLAWSKDHGVTWTWSDWTFKTSFGAPTFLNFGRNYADARDRYVYLYSFDRDDAYTAADRMVLARTPIDRLTSRSDYEFFTRLDGQGKPRWSGNIDQRGAVFEHPGECYRSGITFNKALGRYLWVQILPGSPTRQFRSRDRDPRFRGGFGIYDAPEPWGPWTAVYFTRLWDTGPGETASLPTKWMSADGRTVHLVFSGDDAFSVRRATLILAGDE